ncbi:MAG: gliding motility-associated C-terminal domain-containing protein, partial [Bacteroidales bacterium]|nr:gliding motility-associated C-terminal domain-containing protein [Bacteroidales bacterium]
PDSTFSYRWFDGDTVSPKTVRFAYDSLFFASVEVNGYCSSFRDSTRIRFLPPYVALGKDSLLCTSRIFADTDVLLHLNARQDYFPDADWIFRWQINGRGASENDSLVLRYADLEETGIDFSTALITVAVSLSDAEADACTAHDTLLFSLASLPNASANLFLPQSEILCAHKDLELQLPEVADDYRCFWLDRDSVLLPYGYDTNRYTVVGMRGTDGFGANTDTRNPRFFQLKLDHKLCGVSFFDTLLVYDQVKPSFELPFHDTVICFNEPVELDSLNPFVYRPFYTFEWSDGKTGSDRSFTDSGIYILRFFVLEDFAVCGYDTASDTLRVRWSDPAQTLISIPSDTSFCEKLSVVLDASVPFPSTRYSWQEGNLDDLFSPLDDTSLFSPSVIKVDKEVSLALFVVDTMGCVNTRQITVSEEDCKPSLSVPNVFTPNGDGVNDVLKFKQIDHCYEVDVLIVDRKGTHVLHEKLKNPDEFAWNGCLKNGNKKLPDGAYFYFISYRNAYGKKKYQSGSITILGSRE